jgi:hypothetical protein
VIARVVAVLCALATGARADTKTVDTPPPSPPDPYSEAQANEANLVSNAPRAGMTFSVALGAGLTMGDGVGRGPGASFRVGHVATPHTVLTFEVTIGSLLHEPSPGDLRHNDTGNLMAGALYYLNNSLWVRGAGGLTLYTVSEPGQSTKPHGGIGSLVGVGLDLFRWHYLVLGLETFSSVSLVATRGLMLNSNLGIGLTYY